MVCKNGCSGAADGAGFRRYLDILDSKHQLLNVPKELIGAVCLRESGGYRWFNLTDRQYRDNMRIWMNVTGASEEYLLGLICAKDGPTKGLIPKFRYEPSWKDDAKRWARMHKDSHFYEQIMPLSFGFGQKAMWIYLAGYTEIQWDRLYLQFIHNPDVQLIQVAKDLHTLIEGAMGNVPLALTRYNAGPRARHVSEYGKAVFALYKTLIAHKP